MSSRQDVWPIFSSLIIMSRPRGRNLTHAQRSHLITLLVENPHDTNEQVRRRFTQRWPEGVSHRTITSYRGMVRAFYTVQENGLGSSHLLLPQQPPLQGFPPSGPSQPVSSGNFPSGGANDGLHPVTPHHLGDAHPSSTTHSGIDLQM